MATTEEFTAIVRALNGVVSAGQARAAIGATLNAAGATYKILPRLPDDRERAGRGELDSSRVSLEAYYDGIKSVSAQAELRESFQSRGRKLVERVYIVIGGIEAEASYKPQTSNLAILTSAIAGAPAVLGQAVGAVTREAGQVVGNAAGGILSGLGISGTLTLVVVGAVVLLVISRGTILGRLAGGAS